MALKNHIPKGPWENPHLTEGVYSAVIKKVIQGTYGDDGSTFHRIVLWLPQQRYHFATNIYLPKQAWARSQRRMWYFCQCVDLHPADLIEWPEAFENKLLRIQICTVNGKAVDRQCPYSDVEFFFPPEEDADSCGSCAVGSEEDMRQQVIASELVDLGSDPLLDKD